MPNHPLQKLDGLPLGAFYLRISRIEQMRMSGWRRFSIHLLDSRGHISDLPVLDGIFSSGGKGVQPWLEIASYHPSLTYGSAHDVDLREGNLEPTLFRYLHDILEPGSHIMLWYEGESGRETDLALTRGIPPLLTPLGSILFAVGFFSVRNFHLPEGGHEGGRKLWGERPLNDVVEIERRETALEKTVAYFLEPVRTGLIDIELDARSRAIGVLEQLHSLNENSELSPESYMYLRKTLDELREGTISAGRWPEPVEKYMEKFLPRARKSL